MSSSACWTSGWRPRSANVGGPATAAGRSEVAGVESVITGSIAAVSATPFSVGVVPFVILKNLGAVVSEIIQSEGWSGCGARIRRNQATSLVAAGRCTVEVKRDAELTLHDVVVLAGADLRRSRDHGYLESRRL